LIYGEKIIPRNGIDILFIKVHLADAFYIYETKQSTPLFQVLTPALFVWQCGAKHRGGSLIFKEARNVSLGFSLWLFVKMANGSLLDWICNQLVWICNPNHIIEDLQSDFPKQSGLAINFDSIQLYLFGR